jgi:hypothetical protein
MGNLKFTHAPRGFNQDRPLDEQLISESVNHRPEFSEALHDRIVRSLDKRRDARNGLAVDPLDSDDVLPLRERSAAMPLSYAVVAAAACVAAVLYIFKPAPDETPVVRAPVAVVDDAAPFEAVDGPEAWAEVLELAAEEVTSLASVASSDRWVDSAIELQLAFDEGLQSLPFGSDLVDE